MLGAILFSLVLLMYGFILSGDFFTSLVAGKDNSTQNASLVNFLNKVSNIRKNPSISIILCLSALILGIWNFFAPDFGSLTTPPVLGALIPAVLLFIDGLIIHPSVTNFINLNQEMKDKFNVFLDKISPIAGPLTIAVGIVHLFLFRLIIL